MPKGKTNQPLTFMIPEEWVTEALFEALAEEGHTILTLPPECLKVDVIFSRNSHKMTPSMMEQKGILDVVKKAARKEKKASK